MFRSDVCEGTKTASTVVILSLVKKAVDTINAQLQFY